MVYLYTKSEYLFDHLFCSNSWFFLLPFSLLSQSAPARGKRGFAPFENPTPPLRRLQKGIVLVACYACASDGTWAAFAGHGRTFPLRRASPSSVGDIASSSKLRQPQLVLLNLAPNFINFTNFQLSTDTHPHSGRTSLLRQKTNDRKSGPVDTERSRSGVQKKGVKEQGLLSPARRASFSEGLFGYSTAAGGRAMTLFQQRTMV